MVAAPTVTSDFPGLSEKLITFVDGTVQGLFVCSALPLLEFIPWSELDPVSAISERLLFFLHPCAAQTVVTSVGVLLHIYVKQTERERLLTAAAEEMFITGVTVSHTQYMSSKTSRKKITHTEVQLEIKKE